MYEFFGRGILIEDHRGRASFSISDFEVKVFEIDINGKTTSIGIGVFLNVMTYSDSVCKVYLADGHFQKRNSDLRQRLVRNRLRNSTSDRFMNDRYVVMYKKIYECFEATQDNELMTIWRISLRSSVYQDRKSKSLVFFLKKKIIIGICFFERRCDTEKWLRQFFSRDRSSKLNSWFLTDSKKYEENRKDDKIIFYFTNEFFSLENRLQ